MKNIVHDWDDDKATTILTNVRSAISPGGKVLIVDMVVPETNVPGPRNWWTSRCS